MKKTIIWMICWGIATFVALLMLSYYDLEMAIYALSQSRSCFGEFIQYWGRKPFSILVVAAAYILVNKSLRSKKKLLARMSAAICSHVLLHSAMTVNILKLLVGRPRPSTLDISGGGFVAFFDCSPGFGDFSFPSGHTSIAMSLVPLVYMFFILKDRKNLILSSILTILWGGLVAYGRVIYCAHYLTDTVFSIGSAIVLAPISLLIGDKFLSWITFEEVSQELDVEKNKLDENK